MNLGTLTFGQSKDVVVPLTSEQYEKFNVILDYESPFGEKQRQCKSIIKLDGNEKTLNQQKLRLDFVDTIRKGYELLRSASFDEHQPNVLNNLQALEERIRNHSTDDSYLTDLLADLTGQVNQAFSRVEWFQKWGRHYLPSLTRMSTSFFYSIRSIVSFVRLQVLIYFNSVIISKIQVYKIMAEENCSTMFEMKWIRYFVVYQRRFQPVRVRNTIHRYPRINLSMLRLNL